MPELPEVETMRRGIASIAGGTFASVESCRCRHKPIELLPRLPTLRKRLVGAEIDQVDRLGKRIVLRLSSGDSLIIEPRMTGLVLLSDPPSSEHLRLRFVLEGCGSGEFSYWDRRGLGHIKLLSPRQLAEQLGPDKLGPDALSVTANQLQHRLGASRRAIKVALLDQRAVAGIGNLYAAEILHAARISPLASCDSLSPAAWKDLAASTRRILEQAILYEGSTLNDGTYRNALNQTGRYQNEHQVYARAGTPCPRCGTRIERIVQAQRATFFCPECQQP